MLNQPKYTLLLQNNASKEFFTFSGLTNETDSHLFYRFELDLELPEGEYTYVVFPCERTDVEYEFKNPLIDTVAHTEDGDVVLRDIQPVTGLLRVGETIVQTNIYDDKENNNVFYYDN